MKTGTFSQTIRQWRIGLTAILVIIATVNLISVAVNYSANKMTDLYPYWYAGQHIRQHTDPFWAYMQRIAPQFPLHYIDGSTSNEDEVLGIVYSPKFPPTYTGPLILVFTILSFFPWSTAALLWFAINMLSAFILPYFIWRFLRNYRLQIHARTAILLPALYLGINMTLRGALDHGQSTNFVFLLMMIALDLAESDHHMPAGLALSIALSKYSIALPMVIFFLLERRFKALIWTGLFFFLSILILGFLVNTSPVNILSENLMLAINIENSGVSQEVGIHLAGYFSPSLFITLLFAAITVSPLIVVLWGWFDKRSNLASSTLFRAHILSALMTLSILAIRHLGYDAFTVVLGLILLLMTGLNDTEGSSRLLEHCLVVVGLAVLILLTLPGSVYRFVFQSQVVDRLAMTIAAVILYGADILFLWNLRRRRPVVSTAAMSEAA